MASTHSTRRSQRRAVLVLAVAVLAALVVWAACRVWPHAKTPNANDDPRLTSATPFRNVHPDVQYVGDAACARCHKEIAQSFSRHSMNKSIFPVANAPEVERYDQAAHNPFEVQSFRQWVERRDGRVFHHEAAQDARPPIAAEAEVHLAVGSGRHGRSYLIDRDGYLFLSSITWYPQKGRWDLSPGFAQGHQHFGRAVQAECLFCHAGAAAKIGDTLNHYQSPRTRLQAIGCERCHGPGALHVKAAGSSTDVDYSIVNPRHLAPALREAICQQCHLEGKVRVLRKGREHFDFRPGLPLHAFLSVFVEAASAEAEQDFVGHVEQMHASRCFQASGGKLGCVSCHDPHALPTAAEKTAYYREKCIACHISPLPSGGEGLGVRGASPSCSLPRAVRLESSKDDSCIQCHMPAGETNIVHTTIADHRVPRRVITDLRQRTRSRERQANEVIRLADFHRDLRGPAEGEPSRELGIALMELAGREAELVRPKYGQLALPALDAAVAADPDDIPAGQARALALWMIGRRQDAAELFDTLLRKAPERETLLEHAATLATEMILPDPGREYWRRAIQINPYRWRYYQGLATAHAQAREWQEAADVCTQALKLHPFGLELRVLLITCFIQLGDKPRARAELDVLLSLHPPDAAGLRRHFAESLR